MDWQPIESAPKDWSIKMLLYWQNYSYSGDEVGEPIIAIGSWKENYRISRLSEKDRGGLAPAYFADTTEADDYGLARPEHAPTHWMPLPSPPLTSSERSERLSPFPSQ